MDTNRLIGVVACVGDLHAGGETGLFPARYRTKKGNTVHANHRQSWLYECWQDYTQRFKMLSRNVSSHLHINGDMTEGQHHDTKQITVLQEEHAHVAFDVLEPLVALSDTVSGVRGTQVHVGEMGTLEEDVMRRIAEIKHVVPPEGFGKPGQPDFLLHGRAHLRIFGLPFNFAHHVGGGQSPRTRSNAIAAEVHDHIHNAALDGYEIARWVVRSHTHNMAEAHNVRGNSTGLVLGCWQLPTMHGERVSRVSYPDIGAAFIKVYADGTSIREWVKYPLYEPAKNYIEVKQKLTPPAATVRSKRGRTGAKAAK